jgi:uncharacterized protein (TIGR03083 family)
MDMTELARQERTELVAFLETLTPQEWERPSLCAGWRVRDVVAHMFSYEPLTGFGLFVRLAKGAFIPDRVNAVGLAAYADHTPAQLLELARAHVTPRGFTTMFGGMVALLDGVVHHQDIRRALGKPRRIEPERLRTTLHAAMTGPGVGVFRAGKGLRLVATDLDFTVGDGPEVHGAGEALLMAIAGRRGIVQELTGPGQETLRQRIGD